MLCLYCFISKGGKKFNTFNTSKHINTVTAAVLLTVHVVYLYNLFTILSPFIFSNQIKKELIVTGYFNKRIIILLTSGQVQNF